MVRLWLAEGIEPWLRPTIFLPRINVGGSVRLKMAGSMNFRWRKVIGSGLEQGRVRGFEIKSGLGVGHVKLRWKKAENGGESGGKVAGKVEMCGRLCQIEKKNESDEDITIDKEAQGCSIGNQGEASIAGPSGCAPDDSVNVFDDGQAVASIDPVNKSAVFIEYMKNFDGPRVEGKRIGYKTISKPRKVKIKKGIRKPHWLESLYTQKFFEACSIHEHAKKNEKNICCVDCCISICPHCYHAHRFHRLLQIRRYVYHEVVRLDDLERLIDCSNVQAYTINSAKVIFIKKRPQNRQFKSAGNYCTSCDRSLQEPFIHCSLGCKVDFVLKHYRDLTPFLRVCNSLQLGPDFFIPNPNDSGDDGMTNETPRSTIVDLDDPMSTESGSSGSETMSVMCTGFVRKKRSGLVYSCERFSSKVHSEEDMATSMSRRKGVPQRSPMC
ncbi:protein RGF1 INDUCIBLE TRANSCRIPTION FACTOR 1-like [Rutidosis leptorrhynchoides]|uniref:protein RGF1 INDUCIBLE TRANSCRIPTION FACTOR 1-like n=1 Tax=Rutidosis leptorrhynchoides TaxID=125765 RepID=UPI003A9946E4